MTELKFSSPTLFSREFKLLISNAVYATDCTVDWHGACNKKKKERSKDSPPTASGLNVQMEDSKCRCRKSLSSATTKPPAKQSSPPKHLPRMSHPPKR